jgi:hypothetical protein
MSFVRKIKILIRRIAKAEASKVLTSTVGQVVEYDATRNAAKIQLCVRRMRTEDPNNFTTVDLPILEDVPVQQFGSGKLLASVAPAEGSYGTVLFSDRDLEAWLATGGIVDPANMRRWDLSDAIFIPGLYPYVADGDNGQIEEAIKTDRISLRTRSGLTEISVLSDESVTVNVNEGKAAASIDKDGAVAVKAGDGKATVTIDTDGNISITSDGKISAETDGDITATAAGNVSISGASVSVSGPLDVNGCLKVEKAESD